MSRKISIDKLQELSEYLVSDSADVFLLFADLVGSTEYKQNLISIGQPDIFWIMRQLFFLSNSAKIIKKYNGKIVKTIGDEIFAYFDATTDPLEIIKCCIEIISSFDNIKTYKDKSKIETKLSVDFGLTYNGSIDSLEYFDPIGLPVDRCARLNQKSNKGEITFSNEIYELLQEDDFLKNINKEYKITEYEEELKGVGNVKYFKIYISKEKIK